MRSSLRSHFLLGLLVLLVTFGAAEPASAQGVDQSPKHSIEQATGFTNNWDPAHSDGIEQIR